MTIETRTPTFTFTLSFEETVLITAALKQTADYLLDSLKKYQAFSIDEDKTVESMLDGIAKDIETLRALRKRFLSLGKIA